MRKSDLINDIEAKNDSIVQNGKLSLNNRANYAKNTIQLQPTKNDDNLKTAKKIQKVKEKTRSISDVVTKFAVIAAAGITGVVGIQELTPSPIKAEITYLEAFDSEVVYCVSLSEFDEGIKIVLYNDFTNREQTMEEAITEGVFENLQTNMRYTLVITHGTKILAKESLVTKTREQEEFYEEPIEEDPTQEPNSDDPYMEPIEADYPYTNSDGQPINVGDDTGQNGSGREEGDDNPTGYIG